MELHAIPIIGLTGLAGSGKDSVRAVLEQHGYTGLAFADPIRAMLRELLLSAGAELRYMTDRELKEQPIPQLGTSYRQLAQTLGTEWGRALGADIWVRIATARMDELLGATFGPVQFVISDVRFPNEEQLIRQRGGQIWHVVRPGVQPVRAHESEAHVRAIQADYTILNDGTLQDLQGTVLRALQWADSQEADAGPEEPDDPLLCSCSGDGFSVQELETGRCQSCGKAVVI
jgi:hypothetical protein